MAFFSTWTYCSSCSPRWPHASCSMTRYEQAAAAAVALMLVAAGFIFLFAPADAPQGPVERIFYLHVSTAIAAYGCFAVVLIGGVVYLWKESAAADRLPPPPPGGGAPLR